MVSGMVIFIEIEDINGDKRLVNVNFITDIIGNKIYINTGATGEQMSIDCKESYEQIKRRIFDCGNKLKGF